MDKLCPRQDQQGICQEAIQTSRQINVGILNTRILPGDSAVLVERTAATVTAGYERRCAVCQRFIHRGFDPNKIPSDPANGIVNW